MNVQIKVQFGWPITISNDCGSEIVPGVCVQSWSNCLQYKYLILIQLCLIHGSPGFLPVNTLSFSAEQVTNELDLRLSGIDDAIAMERNETIEWTLMTNTAGVSLTPNNVTLVQIIDDDGEC